MSRAIWPSTATRSRNSIDARRTVVRAMRQRGIPTTMLVLPGENRVAFRHVGALSEAIIADEIASRIGGMPAIG